MKIIWIINNYDGNVFHVSMYWKWSVKKQGINTNKIQIEWNLSIADTIGTLESVRYKEVSAIQRYFSRKTFTWDLEKVSAERSCPL